MTESSEVLVNFPREIFWNISKKNLNLGLASQHEGVTTVKDAVEEIKNKQNR